MSEFKITGIKNIYIEKIIQFILEKWIFFFKEGSLILDIYIGYS